VILFQKSNKLIENNGEVNEESFFGIWYNERGGKILNLALLDFKLNEVIS